MYCAREYRLIEREKEQYRYPRDWDIPEGWEAADWADEGGELRPNFWAIERYHIMQKRIKDAMDRIKPSPFRLGACNDVLSAIAPEIDWKEVDIKSLASQCEGEDSPKSYENIRPTLLGELFMYETAADVSQRIRWPE